MNPNPVAQRSRYQPYDSGESRASPRDPRDRSPARYSDGRDTAQFNGGGNRGADGGPRLSDARSNSASFASNRDNFRDSVNRDPPRDFSSREPPRGPKALIDPPSGPRGNSFTPDYRGRGRGGRSLSWRDDSRDRGRIADRDYRDRRDDRPSPAFRDDRPRDRDWVDRRDRDGFRARRPTPPPAGRGRSPIRDVRDPRDARDTRDVRDARDVRDPRDTRDIRDTRDSRDPRDVIRDNRDVRDTRDIRETREARDPRDIRDDVSVENRPRRNSRDGPLSAGSSTDTAPPSSTFNRNYRGAPRGRGRGDWDRGRSRYYDERRSRSPDSRWIRDERDRDRVRDNDARDWDEKSRDDREAREREAKRYKSERAAAEGWNERPPVRTTAESTRSSASPRHENPSWAHDSAGRDDPSTRRPSSNISAADARRASVKSDHLPGRADVPRDRFTVNPSPPPQAPQVPAFGSSVIPNRAAAVPAKAPPTGPKAERTESTSEEPVVPKSPAPMNPPSVVSPTLSVRSVNNVNNVPTGPRAEREQSVNRDGRPSSRQWVRPGLPSTNSRADVNAPTSTVTSQGSAAPAADQSQPPSKAALLESRLDKSNKGISLRGIPQGIFQEPLHQVEEQEDSDSDSVEEGLDDSYFASEIAKVKGKLESIQELSSIRASFSSTGPVHSYSKPYTLKVPDIIKKFIETEQRVVEKTAPLSVSAPTAPILPSVETKPAITPTAVIENPLEKKEKPLEVEATVIIPTVENIEVEKVDAVADAERIRAELEPKDLEAVLPRMKTPPISSLPFGPITPWHEDQEFLRSLKLAESSFIKAAIVRRLDEKARNRQSDILKLKAEYRVHYKNYRHWCNSADPVAARGRKRLAERRASKSGVPAPQLDGRPEGRRTTSRFATEHDFERVLRESEREAREKEEKADQAALQKAASDKEALIPNMLSRQEISESRFQDTSELVPWERTFAVFECLPPIDNFTQEEHEKFESTFLEFPKQWSRIADALPGRTFQDCIQHYYLVKHETNLREKLRTQPRKRRKGRTAKPKSNALTADLKPKEADGEEAPEGETIAERRRPRRAAAPTWNFETGPSESDATPTPGRRTGTPKGDPENPQPKKGRKGGARERGAKAAKQAAVTSAAASPAPRTKEEDMLTVSEWRPPSKSAEPDAVPTPPPGLQEIAAQPLLPADRLPLPSALETISQEKTQQTSSYWSVPEQQSFPQYLAYFGTDWPGISKAMGTKTATMVKNFYQRQINDGGPNASWRNIAETADQQRNNGQSTGKPPQPAVLPGKRRHDGQAIKPPNSEAIEESMAAGQSVIMPQSIIPPHNPKLPILPQVSSGPAAAQPLPPVAKSSKASKQAQQSRAESPSVQSRAPRGPPRGYFNTEGERPASQATPHVPITVAKAEPNPIPASRSRKTVFEAQEPGKVAQQPIRPQDTVMRDYVAPEPQQIRMKQEPSERLNVQQYEPFSTQPQQAGIPAARDAAAKQSTSQFIRSGVPPPPENRRQVVAPPPPVIEMKTGTTDYRRAAQPSNPALPTVASPAEPIRGKSAAPAVSQTYPPRNHQSVLNLISESQGSSASASPPPIIARTPPLAASMGAPPPPSVRDQSFAVPPPIPQGGSQASGVPAPAHTPPAPRQEPIRKTSNIMSLLNDEPSEPRPQPKRVAEVSASSVQSSPKPMPQPPIYQQPLRQAAPPPQPAGPVRREPPIEGHSASYSRPGSTSQGPIRMVESSYSAVAQAQNRQHAGSPMEAPAPDRDYYSRQSVYPIPQQSSASASPQMGPSYHSPHGQQAPIRQSVYEHNPSPPTHYSNHPPMHSSRPNSFDGRQSAASNPTPTPAPPPQSYAPPPQHQVSGHYTNQTQHQHSLPPSRYGSHQSQGPPMSQQMPPQHAPPQHQAQHPPPLSYASHQQSHLHQQPIPPPNRSYTPVGYDQRGYPPPPHGPPQGQDRDQMMRMQMMPDPNRRPPPREYEQPPYDRRIEDPYHQQRGDRRYDDRR